MQDAVKLAAQYGIGGILALVLGFVMYKIGMRMIASLDEMRKAIGEQSKANVSALHELQTEVQLSIANAQVAQASAIGDLSGRISRLESAVGIEDDFPERPTPIERPIPSTQYSITRRVATGGKKP